MDSVDDALTSPVELMLAERVEKALVASELTTDVASDASPEYSVFRSLCSV
ncbi:UNVERIFIED_ORG: hypothetical protein M2179_000715 [Bradyrhizobium japonicum]